MPIFAVSDVVYQALIAAAATVILAYLQMRTRASVQDAAAEASAASGHAAGAAREVRRTLQDNTAATDGKLAGLATVAAATHALVNNNMAVQLRLNAVLARRLAELTGDPEDARAADLAERLAAEHAAKQDGVDRQAREDLGT
jgi:hypothetical protein